MFYQKKANGIWGTQRKKISASDCSNAILLINEAVENGASLSNACERQETLGTVNSEEFASMPPCQIVSILADQGTDIASERTFYHVLHEEKMQNHRGRGQEPYKHAKPTLYCATAPNQVWTWDITYLNGPCKGCFYYLYLVLDLFIRDVVGWEVYEDITISLKALNH